LNLVHGAGPSVPRQSGLPPIGIMMPFRNRNNRPPPGKDPDSIALDLISGHGWLGYYDEPLRFSWSRSMGEGASVLLSATDLAARADFALGQAEISPSTHFIRGPGGEASVEPRVMQVLVALCDAEERVVTREALFRRCWGNVIVGEDSLNRVIAEARRITKAIAPGSFANENHHAHRLSFGRGRRSFPCASIHTAATD